MLKRIFIFLPLFLCANAFAQDVSLEVEAARFAKESQFLHTQKRYEEALEKAETAFALDPDSKICRERLIQALLSMSVETITPGWGMERFASGDVYRGLQVSGDQMRRSLELAQRAVEIQENYGFDSTGQSNLVFIRCHWKQLLRYNTKEAEAEIATFNRRILKQWIEKTYRPVRERFFEEKDNRETFEEFEKVLSVMSSVVRYQTDADIASFFEMVASDVFLDTPEQQDAATIDKILHHYDRLADFAAEYRDQPPEERDPAAEESLQRTAAILEQDSRLRVRLHGWLVRNKLRYYEFKTPQSRASVDAYCRRLEELAKKLPSGIPQEEFSLLYGAARNILFYRFADMEDQDAYDHAAAMLEIANSRNEFASGLTERCLEQIQTLMYVANSLRDPQYQNRKDNVQMQFSPLLSRQIEICANVDPAQAKSLELQAAAAGISLVHHTPVKPWKEEIVLLERDHWLFHDIFLRDDKVYLFQSCHQDINAIWQMAVIDVKTSELKVFPGVLKYTAGKRVSSETTTYESTRSVVSYVDHVNAYVGTGTYSSEILVFPIDGSEPWSIGPEDELPGVMVYGLASMHGKLYAGLKDDQERSWLIAIDLETRKWETLVSSAAKEGKTPFVNLTRGPEFRAFYVDDEHDRLLMFVDNLFGNPNDNKRNLRGLWSLDGKTHEFTHLLPANVRPGVDCFCPGHTPYGDDRVLFGEFWGHHAMLVNLKNVERTETITGSQQRKFRQGTLLDGYLWGAFSKDEDNLKGNFWGRIAVDGGSEPEMLAVPEAVGQSNWAPSFCRATSDGKKLIVGDGFSLILLQFE